MRAVSGILFAAFAAAAACGPALALDRAIQRLEIVYGNGNLGSFTFWFRSGRIYMTTTTQIFAFRDPVEYRPISVPLAGGSVCRDLEAESQDSSGNQRTGRVCAEVTQLGETIWNVRYTIKESGPLYGVQGPDEDDDFRFTLAIGADDCLLTGVKVTSLGAPQDVPEARCVGGSTPVGSPKLEDRLFEVAQ